MTKILRFLVVFVTFSAAHWVAKADVYTVDSVDAESDTVHPGFITRVINYFNENINIDPFHENTIKALSNFELDSLYLAKYNFYITVENDKLSEIKLDIKGSFNSCYDNSRDFTQKSLADFYLNLELKVTELTAYEVPTELKGLK